MAIKFNCPKCGQELNVKDELAGKAGKCPRCKATVTVPSIVPSSPRSVPGPVRKRADDVEEIEEVEEVEEVEVIDDDDRPRKSSRTGKKKNDFDFTEEDDDEPRRKKRSRRDEEEEEDDRITRRPRKASARRREDDDEDEYDDEGGGSEKRKKALARQRRAAWRKATTGMFLMFISMCTYTGGWAVVALSLLVVILGTIAKSIGIIGFAGILMYLFYGLLFVSWILFIVAGAFMVTTPGKNGEMGLGIAALSVGAVSLLFALYLFIAGEMGLDFGSGGFGMRGNVFVVLLLPLLELARLSLLALYQWAVSKAMKERALVDTSLMLAIIIPSSLFAMLLVSYLLGLALIPPSSIGVLYLLEFLALLEMGGWAGLMAWLTLHTMAVRDSMEHAR